MRRAVVVLIGSLLFLPAVARGGELMSHSGLLAALDAATGTIVIEEMRPSPATSGRDAVTLVRATMTPATIFVRARRVSGPGPGGWVGGFIEEAVSDPAFLNTGDFVTVLCQHDGRFTTALEVIVSVIDEPNGEAAPR